MFRKIRSWFHADWCEKCYSEMTVINKKLFMLPITVGHYQSHENAQYYIDNLYFVKKKSEIPTGYYACGLKKYHCPNCHHEITQLNIFLPVRDVEKYEDTIYFKNGELDVLLKD